MRILLPIPRFDYGRPEWGDSYEYHAFVSPLQRLGHEIRVFDTLQADRRGDPRTTGEALLAEAAEFDPDVVFTMLMEDELPIDVVAKLGERAFTINWFADDAWRFRSFTRHVAPAFRAAVTTSLRALPRYKALDVKVVYCPWGFNRDLFHPVDTPTLHDVAFVGQRYGNRAKLIERLRSEGLDVDARGGGWPDGRVDARDIAGVFCSAKVTLNPLSSSGGPLKRLGIRFRGSTRLDNALVHAFHPPLQMKARLVEVAACGAFQLTNSIPELSRMFEVGSEIVVARRYNELLDSIRYFLEHEKERAEIAQNALARAQAEHTFEQRFDFLFNELGLR
jgi:spore maturation protein CgeB